MTKASPPYAAKSRPTSSPKASRGGAAIAALVSVASAVVALTCAASGSVQSPAYAGAKRAAELAASGAVDPGAQPVVPAALATVEEPPSSTRPVAGLGRFRSALSALARGERGEAVRVLWLGDSHTAADYMTGAVRAELFRRYGAGGPGLLRVGIVGGRHDLASFSYTGRFRIDPSPPPRRSTQGDGVFGLAGLRASPLGPARFQVQLAPDSLHGRALFSVLFEVQERAAFEVRLGTRSVRVRGAGAGRRVPGSPILRLELEGSATDTLALQPLAGRPRFYGVIVEGSEPGVVLDALGIDGARLATALAWAEAPFVAEVAARDPDLVVVAYGTNEAFDALNVNAYEAQLSALVGRLQRGAPGADCLVLGPPDALDRSGVSAPRVAAISEVYAVASKKLGCGFVSGQALMGGPGSFAEWMRAQPPLARSDRIHLTPRGYRALGELVAGEVLGAPEVEAPTVRATNSL